MASIKRKIKDAIDALTNARLIAAAPQMYDALCRVHIGTDRNDEGVHIITREILDVCHLARDLARSGKLEG